MGEVHRITSATRGAARPKEDIRVTSLMPLARRRTGLTITA